MIGHKNSVLIFLLLACIPRLATPHQQCRDDVKALAPGFYYVDKITSLGPENDSPITGVVVFSQSEPMQQQGVISPGPIAEALGQLASWKVMSMTNPPFNARPLIAMVDNLQIQGFVAPGTTVQLSAHITGFDPKSPTVVQFSGKATVNGRVVMTLTGGTCLLAPIETLEKPGDSEKRFAALTGKQEATPSRPDVGIFDFTKLVDLEHAVIEPGVSVSAPGRLDEKDWYYATHFPLSPTTPGVILNEMVGQAVHGLQLTKPGEVLVPVEVKGIKISGFVKPPSQITIDAKVDAKKTSGNRVVVNAKLKNADGSRIMLGTYTYEIKAATEVIVH